MSALFSVPTLIDGIALLPSCDSCAYCATAAGSMMGLLPLEGRYAKGDVRRGCRSCGQHGLGRVSDRDAKGWVIVFHGVRNGGSRFLYGDEAASGTGQLRRERPVRIVIGEVGAGSIERARGHRARFEDGHLDPKVSGLDREGLCDGFERPLAGRVGPEERDGEAT